MSNLNDFLGNIDNEFKKENERKSIINKIFINDDNEIKQIQRIKLSALPKEQQQKIIGNFSFLYNEYKNFSNTQETETYLKLLGTLEWIIDTQSNTLYRALKSYEKHLEKTTPTSNEGNTYAVWSEKIELTKEAIGTLERSFEIIHQNKIKINNIFLMERELQSGNLLKTHDTTSLQKRMDEIKRLKEEILNNKDSFEFEVKFTAIQDTLNLFIKVHKSSKTGLEILQQEKNGWLAQLIINLVNFFKEIGIQNPKEIKAIRSNTEWQFWKKPRNELISEVKDQQQTIQIRQDSSKLDEPAPEEAEQHNPKV
jgi:hypothetical protein